MEIQSFLLLLVLAANESSARLKCLFNEDIYPCKCSISINTQEWALECKDSKTTLTELKSALSYFSEEETMTTIVLENLDLGTVPSDLFEGLAVRTLYIYNCDIDFEDGELPSKGLGHSLQFLKINASIKQKNVPLDFKFRNLKNLNELILSSNKITELGNEFFANVSSNLHTLQMFDNGIEKVGEKAFENLRNVKYFQLSGNKFGSLRRNMIPTFAEKLEELSLKHNGLSDLPEDLFTSLPSLEYITLRGNEITTLKQSTWENIIEQLDDIDLSDNPLQCDSDMEWLFEKRVPHDLSGTCAGPEGKEGLRIDEFLKREKQ